MCGKSGERVLREGYKMKNVKIEFTQEEIAMIRKALEIDDMFRAQNMVLAEDENAPAVLRACVALYKAEDDVMWRVRHKLQNAEKKYEA